MWGFGEAAGLGRTLAAGRSGCPSCCTGGRGWDPVLSEELGLEASQPLYLPTLRQFRTALPELPLATSVLQVTQTPARQQVGLGLGAGGHCAC